MGAPWLISRPKTEVSKSCQVALRQGRRYMAEGRRLIVGEKLEIMSNLFSLQVRDFLSQEKSEKINPSAVCRLPSALPTLSTHGIFISQLR
ncbi:MAG: hypothetical protein QNJ38_18835 [Prochloraceae cyanobacterium]|nr:hypothetical protein [Prochloraceae cyanobacterium]